MIKAYFPNKTLTIQPTHSTAQPTRRFAIGDIHGCLQTLQKMVWEAINLTQQDQLFLLGDYINRGPYSAEVLDFIMELQSQNYQVFPLRGNHEAMLLESWEDFQSLKHTNAKEKFVDWVNDEALVDEQDRLAPRFTTFLDNLPYYYELNDFYLVHAGFDFELGVPNGLQDFEQMLWVRSFVPDYSQMAHKKVIHGHVVTSIEEIKEAVLDRGGVIPLDNGCYKGLQPMYNPYYGSLCALNLDTYELLLIKNLDAEDRKI
ncbi:MAG TPA: serine/threonine protein phosphatase [Microscillaceae bacterium]|nr:serine/threonine protein phosphatase [Microscillaceae bacterium]